MNRPPSALSMLLFRHTRRRDLLGLGLVALSAGPVMPRRSFAQPRYPERPIGLVIPFPPCGGYDAVGRPWADKMTLGPRQSRQSGWAG
jgi:hypothetical protein